VCSTTILLTGSQILRPGRCSEDRALPGGQTTPTPKQIDFRPGELLGSVSGGLGLRKFLEGLGHTFIVTSDKEGPSSAFERALPGAEIVISQPFWPAYLTAERIAKAKELKLAITAGIGSDHINLQAAIEHGVTVAEVTVRSPEKPRPTCALIWYPHSP
jgi:formate dehydrogenase